MVRRSGAATVLGAAALVWALGAGGANAGSIPRVVGGCSIAPGGAGPASAGLQAGAEATGSGSGARATSGLSPDGSAFVRATMGDLAVTKTIERSGRFRMSLRRGDDAVDIAGDDTGVVVTRNGQSLRLEGATAGEDELLEVRALLAGSRGVRAYRLLAAGIGPNAERTPAGMALALTDAMIGLLDGDVTAVQRLAERLGRKRAGMRQIRFAAGCYETYEGEVTRAWDDYLDCAATYWGVSLWRDACGLRWALWAESAWFSFLTCAISPFIST